MSFIQNQNFTFIRSNGGKMFLYTGHLMNDIWFSIIYFCALLGYTDQTNFFVFSQFSIVKHINILVTVMVGRRRGITSSGRRRRGES
jgi:hypothetical protein